MQWNSPNLLKLSTYHTEISILMMAIFSTTNTPKLHISQLLLSGLCVSYIFHTRLYVVYPYIVIFCLCCETTFFATYHDYYYLVTTEIDLLLIYLCKSKDPSFVIPPKRPDYSGYLHKLLYLILFYNLKSKPIIYAQNINTYHLLNISTALDPSCLSSRI